MSDMSNAQYANGFDKNIHQRWGRATKEPLFRKGAHGRLELISNPNTQIQRSEKNNKWESVSLKQQAAGAAAPTFGGLQKAQEKAQATTVAR